MSKRILSLVLTLTLVLGSFSMAFADHADTTLTRDEKIEYLKKEGFIVGNESGDDMLDAKIDRASVARILARTVLGGTGQTPAEIEAEIAKSNYKGIFKDVPQSHWANAPVNIVTEKQITVGTGQGEFSPDRNITYVEVIAMMNRILELDVQEGNDWNMNKVYNIAAARDAGILEGIDFENFNYDDVAIRGVIFELLYNTVARHEVGNYQVDKVLVLENDRVISMKSNEIVVEVIKEVQRANFVDSSRVEADERRGDQFKITLPEGEFDAEDLLGKVIDLSYDKSKKAVAVKLDDSYDYVSGSMELLDKKLTVAGNTYTVSKGEKYKDYDDERIFNTYVNNEAFSYENARENHSKVDFGKATIKNGKVIFIDAFEFSDVAPVKEVNEDGTKVTVYNDMNNGGTKRIELKDEKIVSFDNGSFHKMDKADIDELDVIHVALDKNDDIEVVVVRTDAQVNGEYKKVIDYRKGKVTVLVDDTEYEILDTNSKRPVYAYDSKDFNTLYRKDASDVLKEFIKEEVTILQDVNGDLQYLGSKIDFGEFVGIVDKIVGKEVRILKSDDKKADYSATLDSKFKIGTSNTTGHQNLQAFNEGDLVFMSTTKDNIDKMSLLEKADVTGKTVKTPMNKNFITVDGVEYSVLNRTNVFVKDGDKTYATTMDYVVDNYKSGNVEAIVVSDEQYKEDSIDARKDFGGNAGIANTIVFTKIELEEDLDMKTVLIEDIRNKNQEIRVKLPNGEGFKTYEIVKDSDAYDALVKGTVSKKDVVKIGIDKDNDTLVHTIEALNTSVSGEVDSFNAANRTIKLKNGSTYNMINDFADLTKNGIADGEYVRVFLESGRVVAVTDAIQTSTAGTLTYINVAEQLIEVDNKVLALDTRVRLLDSDGKTMNIGKEEVINKLDELKRAGETIIFSDIVQDNNIATELRLKAIKSDEEDEELPPVGENEIQGEFQPNLSGSIVEFNVTDGTKVTEVTLNGDVLSASDLDYAISGNQVRVFMGDKTGENDKITVTVDEKVFEVKF